MSKATFGDPSVVSLSPGQLLQRARQLGNSDLDQMTAGWLARCALETFVIVQTGLPLGSRGENLALAMKLKGFDGKARRKFQMIMTRGSRCVHNFRHKGTSARYLVMMVEEFIQEHQPSGEPETDAKYRESLKLVARGWSRGLPGPEQIEERSAAIRRERNNKQRRMNMRVRQGKRLLAASAYQALEMAVQSAENLIAIESYKEAVGILAPVFDTALRWRAIIQLGKGEVVGTQAEIVDQLRGELLLEKHESQQLHEFLKRHPKATQNYVTALMERTAELVAFFVPHDPNQATSSNEVAA